MSTSEAGKLVLGGQNTNLNEKLHSKKGRSTFHLFSSYILAGFPTDTHDQNCVICCPTFFVVCPTNISVKFIILVIVHISVNSVKYDLSPFVINFLIKKTSVKL